MVGYINYMAKKRNTDFRLGLNRQQLIEGASFLGMDEKQAKKSNTQRLERFITRKLSQEDSTNEIDTDKQKVKPKRTKVVIPELNQKQRNDIAESAKAFGIKEGLYMVTTRIRKNTGNINENNFLRLSVGSALQGYLDRTVTNEDITEIITRFNTSKNDIISGIEKGELYYYQIMEDYSYEVNEESQ